MSEEIKPTYEQLAVHLRANQIAVDVARAQRNQALDQIADLTARQDQANTVIQTLVADKQQLQDRLTEAEFALRPQPVAVPDGAGLDDLARKHLSVQAKAVPANRAERRKK